MTPEHQRIAIAKECGFKKEVGCTGIIRWRSKDRLIDKLPHYLNDLNAMHEAEMDLTYDLRKKFREELQYMIAPNTKPGPVRGIVLMSMDDYDKWFHATAAQRAEAFLRTIGQWVD